MDITNICMICLENKNNLRNISNQNATEICPKLKLEKCVPEIDWDSDFYICSPCSELLDKAYNFRDFCVKSQDARLHTWQKIINFKSKNVNNTKLEDILDPSKEIITEEPATFQSTELWCFHCSEKFCNKTFLAKHIKTIHKKLVEYFCKRCDKRYVNKSSCMKHEEICYSERNKDEEIVLVQEDLDFEVKQNGNASKQKDGLNICDVCGTSFNNKYLLKRHKRNVHATEKNFKCDQCPSTFVSSVYLNAHKKYHNGDRKHICLFCGKRYITASDLYHHEKIHENKRAYKCLDCDKAFNTSSDLHKHKICVHMDRNLWKYSCEYCSRKFPLKTNLDTHVKTHTGERNFSCHLCDKKCISRSALTRHIDSHTNVKSLKCKLCNLGYKYKKSLEIHMVKNHGVGNVKIPEREKKYFCHLCPKSYYANSKLEKHVKSHTGDKPFKCPDCDKCFVDKSYIRQHLRCAHNKDVAD